MAMRILDADVDIWAIRAEDPDKEIAGRVWTTEVVIGLKGENNPRFSLRLLVSTPEQTLDITPATPGLVQQIAEKCSLTKDDFQVNPAPGRITTDAQAEALIEILEDSARRLPIFVLTIPDDNQTDAAPSLDPVALSRATVGIAHVFVVNSACTWKLTDRFERKRSVFGGAVRAYMPGFDRLCNPYEHRLVLADRLRTPEEKNLCSKWMRQIAATQSLRRERLGESVLTFASVRTLALEQMQKLAVSSGANETALLAAAQNRIQALESSLIEYSELNNYFDEQHKIAEARAISAEQQLRAAAHRIQILLSKFSGNEASEDESATLPMDWSGFSTWCDEQLAGRLTLSPAARRAVKSRPIFEDVALAGRCILWLATVYRRRKSEGSGGSLADEYLEEGIRNAHCGADSFDFDWQGRRQTADWHVKNGGNTRDPRRCLRIYYCWDEETSQVIVADMPAHRQTGAT